jgi:predicted RNase H-like nuclease (RuvC/YqgF family)
MSKHKQILFDWEPPPAGKNEGEVVSKIVSEIMRLSIAGYTSPPPAIIPEDRKLLTKAAIEREKRRQAEHDERIEALEREEERLRSENKKVAALHRRLKDLAEEQTAEQRQIKQKQRARESAEHLQTSLAEGQRRQAAAAEARHAQARHAQWRRDEYIQGMEKILDDWNRANNPPAPVEREIVYVEEEPPGAGALPRLPSWR